MSADTNARSLYWRACLEGGVWRRAAKLGLVVGLIQVGVNQGDHWLRHQVDAAVVAKSILSPLLSFSIAFASAASTRVENLQRSLS
ncbi:MAG TPA: hypothetical protein VHO24_21515 [Opitutaceae bacterium]|nr:hypothetical protein [Opitutaceae bacterium]